MFLAQRYENAMSATAEHVRGASAVFQMEHVIKLVCSSSGEAKLQQTFGGGRLDWSTVEKALQADVVEIVGRGVPPCFPQGSENAGLTRRIFSALEEVVVVVRKGSFLWAVPI